MDLAWKWRWPETVECMRGTLADQVSFMKQRPDFTFLESSPPVWFALQDRDPGLFGDLMQFGQRGQFEPAGGMWCEPDGQMLGAESWVRQVLFGQRAARDVCGVQSRAGHNTDAFGFTWALPKIYAHAEMEAFLTQKLRYNQFTIFEDVLFWWESDDGTRILGVHTYPDHYQEIDPDEMAEAVRIFHLTSGVYSAALLFGIGNHGGGPLPDMFERIDELRRLTVYPTVHLGGMNAYLDHLKTAEAAALEHLPVIRDELFLECHHKTYTVQAEVKAANRSAERALYQAEALSVLAGFDSTETLEKAWQLVLFNQFHDILPGTSFPMVYQDVFDDYDRAFEIIDATADDALYKLLDNGEQLFVVNTLPWRRDAVVVFDVTGRERHGSVRDDAGAVYPCQRMTSDGPMTVVLTDLPAFGLRRIEYTGPSADVSEPGVRASLGAVFPALDPAAARRVTQRTARRPPPSAGTGPMVHRQDWACGENWAENRFFRVEFDPDTGTIASLVLADGTQLAGTGRIGGLDLLEDSPEGFYQTWNMNLTGREDRARCDGFALADTGPVYAMFRSEFSFGRWEKKKDFMVPIMWHTPGIDYPTSFFTVDTTVFADLPWIECVMYCDWWEDDTDLKVAAATALQNTRAAYSIAFGQIERPTKRDTAYEKARYEVPALNWADLSDGNHGLAILNTGRHGHDALDNTLRLTLLTSPYGGEKVHVTDPLADRGRHEIHYAFYPHSGDAAVGEVARVAAEYEHDTPAAMGGQPGMPVGRDLLAVNPRHLLNTAVKPAENGDGFIVRLYEPHGRTVPLNISGPLADGSVEPVNFLENPQGTDLPDSVGPHQILSLRFRPR